MFAFIAALAATWYIFFVSFSALFTACAFNKSWTRKVVLVFGRARQLYFLADVGVSTFTEFPLHFAVFQYTATKIVQLFGAFRYSLAWLAYFVDLAIIAALLALFVESLQEKTVVEEAVRDLVDGDPTEPMDSIVSYQYFNRLLKPFWQSPDIILYPNITYATSEEMTEAVERTKDYDQPRKMALDVYAHAKAPKNAGLRPVLVHIHGGAWRMGKKDILYPHEADLITQDNWIVVNIGYRLAPKNPYPTHLHDVKRALRWIKRSISVFGGDPNFIVVSGDSAGGHLAALAALTANDPQYQPGFEEVDTSVQGVISINGVLDLLEDGRAEFFARLVAMQDKVDTEFLQKHSPKHLLSKAKQDGRLVPFFVITGERDSVVDLSVSVHFKEAYDQVVGDKSAGTQCTLLKLPGAHHVCHIMWSPRSLHIARITQAWCRQLYNKRK